MFKVNDRIVHKEHVSNPIYLINEIKKNEVAVILYKKTKPWFTTISMDELQNYMLLSTAIKKYPELFI